MVGQMDGVGGVNGLCIVVVGGGVGGLEFVMWLGDKFGKCGVVQVILVDCNFIYIWKLLLYEVVVGSMDLNMYQFEYVVQVCWYGFEFQQGELKGFDCVVKFIIVFGCVDVDGIEVLFECVILYDMLVLFIGSVMYFFGVLGMVEYVIVLDIVWQVECFCCRFIVVCMCVQNGVGDVCLQVDIVIVGVGVIGVEFLVELCNMVYVLVVYGLYKLDLCYDICIYLIEGGLCILLVFKECIFVVIIELLYKFDVDVIISEWVMEVIVSVVNMVSGKFILVDLIVWVVGICVLLVLGELGLLVNKLGQVVVLCMLQVEGDDLIYVFGDCVSCLWFEVLISVLLCVQVVYQQVIYLFDVLCKCMDGKLVQLFVFKDFGLLVLLGYFSVVGSLMGGLIGGLMFIEGLMVWLMYMLLYCMYVLVLYGWVCMLVDMVMYWLCSKMNLWVKLYQVVFVVCVGCLVLQ